MSVWRPVKVQRFDAEPYERYVRRRDAVVFIVEGFRHGRFSPELADRMDRLLKVLTPRPAERRTRRVTEADLAEVESYYALPMPRQDVVHERLRPQPWAEMHA